MAINITEDFKENDKQIDLELEELRKQIADLPGQVAVTGYTGTMYVSATSGGTADKLATFENGILKSVV